MKILKVVYCASNTHPSLDHPSVVTVTQSLLFSINKWNGIKGSDGEKHVPLEPDPLMVTAQGKLKTVIATTRTWDLPDSNNKCFWQDSNRGLFELKYSV